MLLNDEESNFSVYMIKNILELEPTPNAVHDDKMIISPIFNARPS